MSTPLSIAGFLSTLRWIDGTPMLDHIEPYRLALFERFFSRDNAGRFLFNLMLAGRGKKNAKTLDLVLAALFCMISESAEGYDADCSLLANDKDQAADDLSLAKKLVSANPFLQDFVILRRDRIERRDGLGFLEILPAGDIVGQHGKSRRFVGYDEIHGYRDWDVFESMQPDPHRLDAQQWATSYASLFHKPGVPLFDMMATGKAGRDPRMLFSWYGADFTTDPDFADATPEARANPSMSSWADAGYLDQQRLRLPAHKFRRLHLNLPGLPQGSAFAAEPIMDAIERGVTVRLPEPGVRYSAFTDMSGGSSDDATLAIGHRDIDGRAILDRLLNQGQPVPFDPRKAVARFVAVLKDYKVNSVSGDKYAGETFIADFQSHGIAYRVCDKSKSELYEAFESRLNGHNVVLLDLPILEQQLLGLVWRGGKISDANEHDDYANSCCGLCCALLSDAVERISPALLTACLTAGKGEPDPLFAGRARYTPESSGSKFRPDSAPESRRSREDDFD